MLYKERNVFKIHLYLRDFSNWDIDQISTSGTARTVLIGISNGDLSSFNGLHGVSSDLLEPVVNLELKLNRDLPGLCFSVRVVLKILTRKYQFR